jgi:hypothetical protein
MDRNVSSFANGLAKTFGWKRERLAAARKRLEGPYVHLVRHAGRYTRPALYHIVDIAKQGERDRQRLIEGALARLQL